MNHGELPDPQLRFVFEARVDVDPMVYVGAGGQDKLLVFPIVGGVVAGPDLNGRIIPGGADWATARSERVTELEARYLIEADDGGVIDIVNRGFHVATPEVIARLDAGAPVSELEYYYRTSAMFRTDSAQHQWLTHTVVIGMARAEGTQVCIRFFALE